jgi:hypothetical protein
MGFKSHKYLWVLSPFVYPYDKLSHIILGFLSKYNKLLYSHNFIFVLVLYQLMNGLYGDELKISYRLPSIFEYLIGYVIAIYIKL